MIELFSLQFFRNAFAVSLILGVIFGLFSFFVVIRKMSFLGVGIAHTAFGGVALGALLGINPFVTALVFCVLSAIVIGRLSKKNSMSVDTGIGIVFSLAMALGAVFLALKKDYSFDITGYLFGNILGIGPFDIWATIIALTVFVPFILIFMRRILFMSFDEEAAYTGGINTDLMDTLLLVVFAGIVVVSIKVVGIILVSALVVLPASFGMLFSQRYKNVIITGIVYSVIIMTGGLFLSYGIDSPAGATIVTLGGIVYFLGVGIKRLSARN